MEKQIDSRTKFIALAEKRVSRAIRDLRLIGNLSNRSNYSYTDDDARKILSALEQEVKALKKRFERVQDREDIVFKLSSGD